MGWAYWTLATISLSSCVMQETRSQPAIDRRCVPQKGEIFGATADSLLGGPGSVPVAATGAHVDYERDIVSSAALRTHDRLYGLRYDLGQYRTKHGGLPSTLEEFYPSDRTGFMRNMDGWGSSIRYTQIAADEYELRAPGPDHRLCTPDDMIVRNDTFVDLPATMNELMRRYGERPRP